MLRALKRRLGLAPTYESAVVAEMVVALKTASEAALQTQVEAVAVTAPWTAAWDKQLPAVLVSEEWWAANRRSVFFIRLANYGPATSYANLYSRWSVMRL
jgi:hypothetical protein